MVSALIIVDVQNDFLPGGALAIKGGDTIIARINELSRLPFKRVVASQDWHPQDHSSFATNQGKLVGEVIMLDGLQQILWPTHCVQDTFGAELAADLDTTHFDRLFYKGVDPSIDSYSCFFDNGHRQSTGMVEYLQDEGITRLFFAGLATDYCVKYSVLDALQLGFEAYVISDVCRGVDVQADDCQTALREMERAGAHLITAEQLLTTPALYTQYSK